jgi:hypothetical protein
MCQTQELKTLKSVQEDKTHRKRLRFVSVVDRHSGDDDDDDDTA